MGATAKALEWSPADVVKGALGNSFAFAVLKEELKHMHRTLREDAALSKPRNRSTAAQLGPWRDWFVSLCRKHAVTHKYGKDTIALAVQYLDRFIGAVELPKATRTEPWLKRAAYVSLMLASKLLEMDEKRLHIRDVMHHCSDSSTLEEVRGMEMQIVMEFTWKLNFVTPHSLWRLLLSIAVHEHAEEREEGPLVLGVDPDWPTLLKDAEDCADLSLPWGSEIDVGVVAYAAAVAAVNHQRELSVGGTGALLDIILRHAEDNGLSTGAINECADRMLKDLQDALVTPKAAYGPRRESFAGPKPRRASPCSVAADLDSSDSDSDNEGEHGRYSVCASPPHVGKPRAESFHQGGHWVPLMRPIVRTAALHQPERDGSATPPIWRSRDLLRSAACRGAMEAESGGAGTPSKRPSSLFVMGGGAFSTPEAKRARPSPRDSATPMGSGCSALTASTMGLNIH